jgi:hypothetical protein
LRREKIGREKLQAFKGIFLLKPPPYRSSPSQLVVEINPIDASGNPTKKRGLILRNSLELNEFRRLTKLSLKCL